jgi:hypothetical protein
MFEQSLRHVENMKLKMPLCKPSRKKWGWGEDTEYLWLKLNSKIHFKKSIIILGKMKVGSPLQATTAFPLGIEIPEPAK